MFWPRMNAVRRSATCGNPLDIFNRVMADTFAATTGRNRSASPAFNLWTDETGAVLTSELPGVQLEDLDITVSGSQVSVASGRSEEIAERQRPVRRERLQGKFQRAFKLPFSVDSNKVEATLVNGVLHVVLPRAESDKPRKIEIHAE